MDESDQLYDQIDDFIIEFPLDCNGHLANSDESHKDDDIPTLQWSTNEEPLLISHDNDLEFSVPYEDVAELEWLSTFVEDSYSGGGLTIGQDISSTNIEPLHSQFQTSSPVSVLESSSTSSSCSAEKIAAAHRGPQRARSKRPRPTTFNPRPLIQPFIDSLQILTSSSEISENFGESSCLKNKKKKKKKKIGSTPGVGTMNIEKMKVSSEEEDLQNPPPPVRKCLHCEITKTPQWRAGPMGPKTLCNACGVRYKSGRLFPEYRPAASPTFVPSVHSNSHKKVLEMRNITEKPELVSNE
ncbi:GATA transcription factor 8-like [Andrographis paniculata]|uniref:GATA transcription factor 8-like n=1 Tax=Andrographis paniculata TaxID=175694 RepID=UPI0021E6F224|nr:GATA transcription factor 8-like [Andrographis paniculata]